jgi:hypothetical protein
MEKSFFDKELIKNKMIFQPSNKNSKIILEETESVCEDCEIILGGCVGGFHSEEFVWHPDKAY